MKLHPITWLMIALAIVEFGAALLAFTDGARSLGLGYQPVLPAGLPVTNWVAFLAASIPSMTYGLGWLGSAAMVEFLFRIWRELRAIRAAKP